MASSTWVVRGDPATRAFSTFGFRDGKLAVVESVNKAGDHAAAKRIIGTTKTLTPEEAADPAFDLRGLGEAVSGGSPYAAFRCISPTRSTSADFCCSKAVRTGPSSPLDWIALS